VLAYENQHTASMFRIHVVRSGIVAGLIVFAAACGGSSSPSTPTAPSSSTASPPAAPPPVTVVAPVTTTFEGSIAGGAGQSGAFSITIESAVSASASGSGVRPLAVVGSSGTLTLINGGGTSTITGTFDTATGNLTGSGGGYALTGAVSAGAFTGLYTGPTNTSGAFASLKSTGTTVTVMCGTYTGANTGSGIWNLQVSASGAASGVTRPNLSLRDPQPRSELMTGQLVGQKLTLTVVDPNGFSASATGTVQGTSVSGTHDDGRGTFSGSAAACR
jgi:hypothetical protein